MKHRVLKRRQIPRFVVLSVLLWAVPAEAQYSEVCTVPRSIEGPARFPLEDLRETYLTEQIGQIVAGEAFNLRCRDVTTGTVKFSDCNREFDELNDRRRRLNARVEALCSKIENTAFGIATEAAFKALFRQGLDQYEEHQREAVSRNWSDVAKTGFLLSTLAAMRGRFKRALATIRFARKYTPSDPAIDKLYEILLTRAIDAHDHPGGELVDPLAIDRGIEQANRQAHGMILRASLLLGQGDYESAIKLFSRAKETAKFSAGTQAALNKALVWTRQLRAAADERLAPGRLKVLYRAQREQAAAEQAWRLGLAMALRGMARDAGGLYDEAHGFFRNESGYPGEVIAQQRRQLQQGRLKREDEVAEFLALPLSRTDAVLDALEYGKGDWRRSLNYIRNRRRILPDNLHLRDAENYLEGLGAGR